MGPQLRSWNQAAVTSDEYRIFLERFGKIIIDCDVVTASEAPRGVPPASIGNLYVLPSQWKMFLLDTSGEY